MVSKKSLIRNKKLEKINKLILGLCIQRYIQRYLGCNDLMTTKPFYQFSLPSVLENFAHSASISGNGDQSLTKILDDDFG